MVGHNPLTNAAKTMSFSLRLRLHYKATHAAGVRRLTEIIMKNIIIGIFITSLMSMPAYAMYVTPLAGPGVDVTRVFIHKSGAVSIYISGDTQNLDKCTSTFRVYIPETVAGKDAMLSVALMAHASGKKIGIHGSGCSVTQFWGGTVDVPIVDNLWVF